MGSYEEIESKITCRFCEQYAGRVGTLREYGCPDCEVGCVPEGHHHHILFPALEEVKVILKPFKKHKVNLTLSPKLREEFQQWKRRKYEGNL